MTPVKYLLWSMLVLFAATAINMSPGSGSGGGYSGWSSGSSGGSWSSGGGHK